MRSGAQVELDLLLHGLHIVLQPDAFAARLRKLLFGLGFLRHDGFHCGGVAGVGHGELVARIDEAHQVLELGLLGQEPLVDLLQCRGSDRQLRFGRPQLFGCRAFPGFERTERNRPLRMLRLQPRNGLGGLADLGELADVFDFIRSTLASRRRVATAI